MASWSSADELDGQGSAERRWDILSGEVATLYWAGLDSYAREDWAGAAAKFYQIMSLEPEFSEAQAKLEEVRSHIVSSQDCLPCEIMHGAGE